MRILLVAPGQPDLDSVREIRILTSQHTVEILNGKVLPEDVYAVCRLRKFDAIHFATHSNSQYVALYEKAVLTADDVAQLIRMASVRLVVFNSCTSARLALVAVDHGATYAVYASEQLSDEAAWRFASAFYGGLRNGHGSFIVEAFDVANNRDGQYGLVVSTAHLLAQEHLSEQNAKAAQNEGTRRAPMTVKHLLIVLAFYTAFVVAALALTFIASGRGN